MSWCANHIFIRRSKRMKQLVFRMNQMIDNNIKEYPGDRATLAEFYNSIRCKFITTIERLFFVHSKNFIRF